ncbi:Fungalysin metallopeptidase-domain-containing protein [Rhizoctonia solani]|nr:Fungalysin metallopeptidase-domain-containing protein [Rhizoctonia solani]
MAPLIELAAVALFVSTGAIAAPWNPVARHTTHHSRSIGPNGVKAGVYQPESTFETYGVNGIDHPLSKRANPASPQEAAKSFLTSKLGLTVDSLVHRTGHTDNRTRVANEYFCQQFNGIQVANAIANVAVKDDKVLSFGASFIKPKSVASTTPIFPKQNAIAKAEALTGAKYNAIPVGLEYFAKENNQLVLTHTVQVQNATTAEAYLVYVDASNGEVVNLVDFTAKASYRVIPFSSQDPRDGFQIITNPHDPISSPKGWHQYGTTTTTSTSGNNVDSYDGTTAKQSSQSSATNNYNYVFNPKAEPTISPNVDVSRVNAFYLANMVHDLTYRYGFTETSYNFQRNNNGLGGAQGDPVFISVQDPLFTDNAAFTTFPDGQPGMMRMFLWTKTSPQRDGALENDIVIHEYGHGISNRLTGGGTASCLQTTEARGLGEGWSDALTDWVEQKNATDRDFILGSYVNTQNIRTYPYSINKTTNPMTYASLNGLDEEHSIGEVWALIWHEIYAALIKQYGFTTEKNNPDSKAGNVVALHLFIDSMKLQPCNPTFVSARDAVIQADANRYGGVNKCLLWKAYAKRGLGYGEDSSSYGS